MNRIKEMLIHLLGGHTDDELNWYIEQTERQTKKSAYANVKRQMDAIYGMNADEWCAAMYEFTKRHLDGRS